MAVTGRTGLRLRAKLRAGARTRLAGDGCRHFKARRLARISLLERDLHVVAKIRAALAPRGATAPAHHITEEIIENVGHRRGEALAHSAKSAGPTATIKGGVAEAVVSRALLCVGEDLVGL